ncbi:MAG: hypothetical protein JJE04_23985 [Acidobacteriia bacterium]|nr:hypothetical protein [Terriglobia bacterium]
MTRWKRKAALACLIMWAVVLGRAMAAPPLTTVQDMLYKADGRPFTGMVIINWNSFDAADTSNIATNVLQLRIINGLLRTKLVPTTNASAGAYYAVRYVSDGKVQFTESWAVPPSLVQVRIRDVRIATPPTAGQVSQVEIADVNGLTEELEIRPVKGLNYIGPRAAVITADGSIEAAIGDDAECVRVDGSAGPCGGGTTGVSATTFIDAETPNGDLNGVNTAFTLAGTPNPSSSLLLYRNGILMKLNLDFTLSAGTIDFASGAIPQAGDILAASYRKMDVGSTLAQVLCIGPGLATSQTASTSLAACNIAAGLLKVGDRVEVIFDYSHEGSVTGFFYELRWGSTNLLTRTASSGVGFATGRASLGITSGANRSVQSWGNGGLSHAADAGLSGDNALAGLVLDLRGFMASATSDTVTLRNYTVIRYPAQ